MINSKKVVFVISARMSSTRLPGKVILPLAGKPVIVRIVERLKRSKYVDEIIVATTTNPADEAIESICKENSYKCFRGSEGDVLSRVAGAAKICDADIVFRGMADSPMVDWRIADRLIEILDEGDYDYASNELGSNPYPVGFDASVFSAKVLYEIEKIAKDDVSREHVTYYIYSHPEKYKIYKQQADGSMLWPDLRLTLDTKEDYRLISLIYDNLIGQIEDFSADDIIYFLKQHPEYLLINRDIKQKDTNQS